MAELVDVPLEELEIDTEYVVIFPLIDEIHQAYLTEFIEGNYGELLFKVTSIKSDPSNASLNVGDSFIINSQEVTTDIHDRTKYMVLREQPLYFPPELEHAHVEADIDEEISYLLNNRDRDEETERSRMLRRIMLGSRPLQSPIRSNQNSPNPRCGYRTGGKKHRKRTCKRLTRKYKRNRSKRRRVYRSRKKRKNSRRRR